MERTPRTVDAVETACELLDVLEERREAGVTELAEEVDVNKSTVYNHLSTLRKQHYVVKEGTSYRLSLRSLSMAETVKQEVGPYGTIVEDDTVYVEADGGRIAVGELDTIIELVGGPAWTIEYDESEKRRYDLDTADEGLTVDVVDTIYAMTFGEAFVETLRTQPGSTDDGEVVPPRLGLFVGRLLENLEYGVR